MEWLLSQLLLLVRDIIFYYACITQKLIHWVPQIVTDYQEDLDLVTRHIIIMNEKEDNAKLLLLFFVLKVDDKFM